MEFEDHNDNYESFLSEIPPESPLKKGGGIPGVVRFDKREMGKLGFTYNGYHLPYNSKNVRYARSMRKAMTPAEKKLWYCYLKNFKYRVLRQRPIGHFIVDFYCPELKLVIEVDGGQHCSEEGKSYDDYRTNVLSTYGIRLIRFTNRQVINQFEAVCTEIDLIHSPEKATQ